MKNIHIFYIMSSLKSSLSNTSFLSFFSSEKGFISITDSKEDFEIGEEEFCFEVNFTAYPPVRCMWLFSKKTFPCIQSYSEDGRRYLNILQ